MIRRFKPSNKLTRSSGIDIKNPYLYKEMTNTLNKVSDEKFRHITIETYKYFAKQVYYITAKNGLQYWDREKDIELLSYLVGQLVEHDKLTPNDLQSKFDEIFSKILQIKRYEDEGEKNTATANIIKEEIDWVLKEVDKIKS